MRDRIPLRTLGIGLGAFLVLGMLAACAPAADSAVDLSALLGAADSSPEQPTATQVAEVTPTEPTEAASAPKDEHCIDCHTDQDLLMSLATEAEPEESLSSGEG